MKMNIFKSTAAVFCAALAVGAAAGEEWRENVAQLHWVWRESGRIPGLEYRYESISPARPPHDIAVLRISLRNTLDVPRRLALHRGFAHDIRGDGDAEVTLEPRASATVTLPSAAALSSPGDTDTALTIVEKNPPAKHPSDTPVLQYIRPEWPDIASSQNPSLLMGRGFSAAPFATNAFENVGAAMIMRDPADWPRDPLAYLVFDAVWLTEKEASGLPSEVEDALRAFRALGGDVTVMRDADSAARMSGYEIARSLARPRRRRMQFHKMLISDGETHLKDIPIETGTTPSTRLVIALLALVSLVAMPLAVWICTRRDRRMLLLAIIPGGAFAITAAVALIALAVYGITPTVRLQAVTVADGPDALAVTHGQFAIFSPVDLDGSICVPSDSAVEMHTPAGRRESLTATAGERTVLSGGWTAPLTASFFDFVRVERRRESLAAADMPDGRVMFSNLIGATVRGGFAVRGGRRFRIPRLAPGAEVTLDGTVQAALPHSTAPESLSEVFFGDSTEAASSWPKTAALFDGDGPALPDGSYAVLVEGCPFFPDPLGDHKTHGSAESVVAGTFAPSGGKEDAR